MSSWYPVLNRSEGKSTDRFSRWYQSHLTASRYLSTTMSKTKALPKRLLTKHRMLRYSLTRMEVADWPTGAAWGPPQGHLSTNEVALDILRQYHHKNKNNNNRTLTTSQLSRSITEHISSITQNYNPPLTKQNNNNAVRPRRQSVQCATIDRSSPQLRPRPLHSLYAMERRLDSVELQQSYRGRTIRVYGTRIPARRFTIFMESRWEGWGGRDCGL